jgi:hypothetical protein
MPTYRRATFNKNKFRGRVISEQFVSKGHCHCAGANN